MLVVFIMSVLAFSAVSLTETLDSSQDQYRYERAKNQAAELKKAIIDRVETQQVVRGFVADVGALPANMTELAFGVVDGDPDDSLIPLSDDANPEYDFSDVKYEMPELQLRKGYRGTLLQTAEGTPRDFYRGSYLSNLLPGKNIYDGPDKPRFDDGWGNQIGLLKIGTNEPVGNDDLTHGWFWNDDANGNLTLKTLGKDGLENVPPVTGYPADLQLATISRDDWSVDPSAIQVELYNDLADLNLPLVTKFKILFYNAKATPPTWNVWTSNDVTIPERGQIATANFPPVQPLPRMPAGTHVLMLVAANDHPVAKIGTVRVSETPEIQEIIISPKPTNVTLRLEVPDPTGTEEGDTVVKTGVGPSLALAIVALKQDFDEDGGFTGQDIIKEHSIIRDSVDSSIIIARVEIDISSYSDNSLIQNIEVPPNDLSPSLRSRAKHIHVLPGQTNIFRLNLSDTTLLLPKQ